MVWMGYKCHKMCIPLDLTKRWQGWGVKCYRFDIPCIEPGVLYFIYGKLHMDSMNSLPFASN